MTVAKTLSIGANVSETPRNFLTSYPNTGIFSVYFPEVCTLVFAYTKVIDCVIIINLRSSQLQVQLQIPSYKFKQQLHL